MSTQYVSGAEAEETVRRTTRVLMSLRGVTPAELAAYLQIGKTSLSERLTGKRRFTNAEVADMAVLFGVSPAAFFATSESLLDSSATRVELKTAGEMALSAA